MINQFKISKPKIFLNQLNITQKNKNSNKIIDIEVEEKPTGEIFAGAGTGTTGLL